MPPEPTALAEPTTTASGLIVPSVPGVVSAADLVATGQSIADLQLRSGMIEWYPGGHCDPWNHVETAMALDTVGFTAQAQAAYRWLARIQEDDGSWYQYYLAGENADDPLAPPAVEQWRFDANTVAYIAVGVWHHYLLHGSPDWLVEMWPTVDKAIEWVLELQRPAGDIVWARHADGTPFSFSLLTGSSSMSHSIRAAMAIAFELGHDRPHWSSAAARLSECIRTNEDAFAPKKRWAMDWYYPVMTGVVSGDAGLARMRAGEEQFILEGAGVRCVADQDWVTSAETCEAALAYLTLGERAMAETLFEWAQINRDTDGAYFTGMAFPQRVNFPGGERSAYTAAAIILAADALADATPAARLLWDHEALPAV